MELKNKVSLVTGAGQGIGEGIAKVLASHGSRVMIVDLNGDSAKKVAKEINSLFPNSAKSFEADLTDSNAIKSMIQATLSSFTKLDCICNNAAASKGLGPVENYSLEDVQATLDLTFTSLWKCLQVEIQALKEQAIPASVVNISSNSAIRGYAFNSIYAAKIVPSISMMINREFFAFRNAFDYLRFILFTNFFKMSNRFFPLPNFSPCFNVFINYF